MKNSPHASSTLSPVLRAATFFAFLGLLTLGSCQEDKGPMVEVLDEQTKVFTEMASLLDQVKQGGDPLKAAQSLTVLGEELKELKIKTAAIDHSKSVASGKLLPQHDEFLKAFAAYRKAHQELFLSGKLTPEIKRAIMAHHNPAPMPGEGTP